MLNRTWLSERFMKIPSDALIPPDKITGYLLIPKKSGDKSKYLASAGFDRTNAALLESEIRRIAAEIDAMIERANQHGVYYTVTGSLNGPTGSRRPVKLVWLQRIDGVFTFVTLVPQHGSAE
jgi:hypothetical protein